MALASISIPKTPPKWDPKGGQNPNQKFIDFVSIYNTLATFRGAEIIIFRSFFGALFWIAFGTHFGDFGSLLGFLLKTNLVTFWVPFLHRFLDPLKTSKKGGSALPPQCTLPPPRTPPHFKSLRVLPANTARPGKARAFRKSRQLSCISSRHLSHSRHLSCPNSGHLSINSCYCDHRHT